MLMLLVGLWAPWRCSPWKGHLSEGYRVDNVEETGDCVGHTKPACG